MAKVAPTLPKKPKETLEDVAFTATRFSHLTGCDRHTIAKRLAEMAAQPVGKSRRQGAGEFSLRDLVKAASILSDADETRMRKLTAEADKLDLQNARSRGEMVEIASVKKLGERVLVALRSRILNLPLTDEEKDKCLAELMGLQKIDWSRDA